MPALQRTLQYLRSHGLRRGWSPVLMGAARIFPGLRNYRARLADGDELLLDLSNRMSFQYFYYGELPNELVTAHLVRKVLEPGGGFVDVGANIGYYTRLAARCVGPKGFVVAVEPEPGNFALLKDNVSGLGQVRLVCAAAADRAGTAAFHVHASRDQSSLLAVDHTRRIEVPLVRLDDVTKDMPGCDFLKMDIEGAELEALRGARKLLERHAPVVCFEFAPETTDRFGALLETYVRFFGDFPGCGYRLFRADTPSRPLAGLAEKTACDYMVAVPGRYARVLGVP